MHDTEFSPTNTQTTLPMHFPNHVAAHLLPKLPPRSEFVVAGFFRFTTELAKILAPLLLRELILYVKNEAVVVPNTLAGGVGLALLLLLLLLLQACTLQHFIHGGNVRMLRNVPICSTAEVPQ